MNVVATHIDPPTDAGTHRQEAGFVVLALAQLLVMFGVWLGVWPASFGAGVDAGFGAAAALVVAGVAGFYMAFDLLSEAVVVPEV